MTEQNQTNAAKQSDFPPSDLTMRMNLVPNVSASKTDNRTRLIVLEPSEDSARDGQSDTFLAFLDSFYDAVLVTDPDGTIVATNLRVAGMFKRNKTLLPGGNLMDCIAEPPRDLLLTLQSHLKDKRFVVVQAYGKRSDGSLFPCEIVVNNLPTANRRLGFYFRDTTVRRQAQEMLLTEHTAIQNAASGIVVVNSNLEMEYLNPALIQLWRFSPNDDLRGESLSRLFASGAVAERVYCAVSESSPQATMEAQALRCDGATFEVQVAIGCNLNTDGIKIGVVLSFQDLSDRRLAEAAQREAERNRVMLESLGAACHHLGQPSTILQANLDLLRHKLSPLSPDLCDVFNSCMRAMERLSDVLRRLHKMDEYRTTPYLDGATHHSHSGRQYILDI